MKTQAVVSSQEEYDEAAKNKQYDIVVRSRKTIVIPPNADVTVDHMSSVAAGLDSVVWARDFAHIIAHEAEVFANDHVRVYASNKAIVRAFGFVFVDACGGSNVTASDSARVNATDTCSVWASGKTKVVTRNHCTVYADDEATVEAYDNCIVHCQSPHVTINTHGDNVTIID